MKLAKTLQSLFVTSEAHPLIKTGGLADVAGSLPQALATLKAVRQQPAVNQHILLPGYRSVLAQFDDLKHIADIEHTGHHGPVRLLETKFPDSEITLWLVDAPNCFDRDGGPYADTTGQDWPDNAVRFAVFSRAAVAIALNQLGLNWQPDIVHCHDWQTGLIPALLSLHKKRPATLFTIHNLAYQGVYSAETFFNLGLPQELWHMHGLEYHGNMAFIKGGLAYADWLTTVSPTYAHEIQGPEFGFGLNGLLRHRTEQLNGIINGVDYDDWDPATDPALIENYDAEHFEKKLLNKTALQKQSGLPIDNDIPVLAFIGRLVWQKGIDVLLESLPQLLKLNIQCIILGTGEHAHEQTLLKLQARFPDKLAITIGYDEKFAHQLEAGADMFCMLSRYEPCGLNQLYSLRYGTVPIVRRTGGLADTVIDASQGARSTGFCFNQTNKADFIDAMQRALARYNKPKQWQALAKRGMRRNFGWQQSARHYLALYIKVCRQHT